MTIDRMKIWHEEEIFNPRAERLNFDYTKAVVASGSVVKGDNGWGHGCKNGPNPSGKTFQKKKCI